MAFRTLMLVEAAGIQEYIFGSNQLAQNIGASELVQQATTDWVYDLLPQPNNVQIEPRHVEGFRLDDRSVQADGLHAEVVYSGGGNAMLIFADDDRALTFAQQLTRRSLEDAPGLQLVIQRRSFDPEQTALRDLHQTLRGELARRKLNRPVSAPLMGLGVTAACLFTGAPAVAVDDSEGRLISAEVQAKLAAEAAGKDRLGRYLAGIRDAGFGFADNFNLFGQKGESSYLAIVHADGNNMGLRIKEIGDQYNEPGGNAGYVRALRRFSESVKEIAETALARTAALLIAPDNLSNKLLAGKIPLQCHDGEDILPFRPIVFGGDDVTFVCEGRLGLALAAEYLAVFASQHLAGKPAHGRAGVAVVHSHYPFSRAYELAESLCGSAKKYIQSWQDRDNIGVTALDWHFAVSGLVLPLGDVREREYTAPTGSLLMRPIRLTSPEHDWRSWQTFGRLIGEFQRPADEGGQWAGRRNKLKALRDTLRAGPEAVELFLHGQSLPDVPDRPGMKRQGWQKDKGECGYFDAVEALDFYLPLKGGLAS